MFRLGSKYASGVKFLLQKRFTDCQYLFNIQVLTIIIKLSHVITYVSQNFSVRDLSGQITKSIYQAPYHLPINFPNSFSQARSHFNRMERLLIRQKLILKFHSKKKSLTHEHISENILSAESVKFCLPTVQHLCWSFLAKTRKRFIVDVQLGSKYTSGVNFLQEKRFTDCQYLINIQVLRITIKLSYVTMYVCQNFGVPDVRGKITKSIYQASYRLLSNFPNNFPQGRSYFSRMERLLMRLKLILKFIKVSQKI